MALLLCPECGGKISSYATICPNCGYPSITLNKQINTDYIALPEDLDIGNKIRDWGKTAEFNGIYHQIGHFTTNIPNGKISVSLHNKGIRIKGGSNSYDIHKSQIIRIDRTPSEQIFTTNKSIIGRALIIGVICAVIGFYITYIWGQIVVDKWINMNDNNDFVTSILSTISIVKLRTIFDTIALFISIIIGSTGAVIGGMSGLGQKEELINTQYVTINFWEKESSTPQSILIECNEKEHVGTFIFRQQRAHEISSI